MRRRSFHSSRVTKENSCDSPILKAVDDSNSKPGKSVKPERVAKQLGATSIIRKVLEQRDTKEQKYYKLTELLADPLFLEKCYLELQGKPGNMTRGTDDETIDGINKEWFECTSEKLKSGKFKFRPNRRVEILKSNGKPRAFGIGSPRDKIVQKGLHAILEAIYEPIFLSSSHGFRPGRSVHSALLNLYLKGNKYNWVVQGDISKCFDNIPHFLIIKCVAERVGDPRVMELLNKYLNAGYVDNLGYIHRLKLGTPQGGVLSPLLANIVLHKLDQFMAEEKTRFEKGLVRRKNSAYAALQTKKAKTSDLEVRKRLLREMRLTKRSDTTDPNFRRLEYIRYADDFVILVAGSLKDAGFIKAKVKDILKTKCGLELNDENTTINNMTKKWSYLGTEIRKMRVNSTWLVKHASGGRAIGVNYLLVNAPIKEVINKLKKANLVRLNHKGKVFPMGHTPIMNLSHQEILDFYSSKLRGIISFYSFASNKSSLHSIVWLMKASCALTLAKKYKLRSIRKVFNNYGPLLKCPETDKELYSPP